MEGLKGIPMKFIGQRRNTQGVLTAKKGRRFRFFRRIAMWKSFNFILIHYIYIVFMTFLCSLIIGPRGDMPYIDALFFSAGAATQSGLNTIDVNKLHLYQQIVLISTACLCNPIVINSFVVFVRLYWFEKRFKTIVQDARSLRRNKTGSHAKSEEKSGPDLDAIERGVGTRQIRVLHQNDGPVDDHHDEKQDIVPGGTNGSPIRVSNGNARSPASITFKDIKFDSPTSPGREQPPTSPSFRRDIMFADEVANNGLAPKTSRTNPIQESRIREQSIAFVENQRNPKDKTALRIPGPRDFERGEAPQRIDDTDSDDTIARNESYRAEGGLTSPHTEALRKAVSEDDAEASGHSRGRSDSTGLHPFRHRFHRRNSDNVSLRSQAHRITTFLGRTFTTGKDENSDPLPYLSYTATIGRNSTFVDLTEEQREELGGIEYRSLKTLAWVLCIYFFGISIFGIICLVPWIVRSGRYSSVVREIGESPAWWGVFTPMSMFTDLGFTLTPDSMISFQRAVFPILLGCFLIIAGNTGFPILLRFFIWVGSKIVPHGSGPWEELRFLLDHPRRCFTLLFPRQATWWLFAILVGLNGLDLIFFVLLDLKDDTVTSLPRGIQFLSGLFQAISTRTAGFAVINLADLHPGIQVSYMVMMYISVFPIAISIRKTNVYEERSLGIYIPPTHTSPDEGSDSDSDVESDEVTRSYIGNHLRRQLSFDLWYVFLGLFFICIIEGKRIENLSDTGFTTFSILFEIVSAYGTVGLSLGYPGVNTSFSGQFKPLSKLIIVAMMVRGRHRGLPYALDRAILLPGDDLKRKKQAASKAAQEKEDVDEAVRRGRARTRSKSRHRIARVMTGALNAGPHVSKQKRG